MTPMRSLAAVFALAVAAGSPWASPGEPPAVTLSEAVVLPTGVVRLGDIAVVSGRDARERERLAALDVAELSAKVSSAVITRRQLEFRLSLAGWDGVSVRGADRATVTTNPKPEAGKRGDTAVLVRPRQRVTITVKIGGAEATAVGESVDEGRLGQVIRVKNVDSLKVLVGKVVGPNAVELETGGRP